MDPEAKPAEPGTIHGTKKSGIVLRHCIVRYCTTALHNKILYNITAEPGTVHGTAESGIVERHCRICIVERHCRIRYNDTADSESVQ